MPRRSVWNNLPAFVRLQCGDQHGTLRSPDSSHAKIASRCADLASFGEELRLDDRRSASLAPTHLALCQCCVRILPQFRWCSGTMACEVPLLNQRAPFRVHVVRTKKHQPTISLASMSSQPHRQVSSGGRGSDVVLRGFPR